jgi:hypothetical protein
VGWEYFLKGFLIKDWGYLQGQYYSQMKLNTRKYNSTRWVVRVLTLLNNFRLAMWTLRNSAIHGGPTQLSGMTLRKQLIREVKELYSKDRSILSSSDKDLFKLPLRFRLKQGNHHLLLWTKQATLTFDHYKEVPIDNLQQKRIMDWLVLWKTDESQSRQEYETSQVENTCSQICPDSVSTDDKEQMEISTWLKSWGDLNDIELTDGATAPSTVGFDD